MPLDQMQHGAEANGGGQPGALGTVLRIVPQTALRQLDNLTWGLLPYDTRDPGSAPRPTHARAGTVAIRPMFADAFQHRRAIVPADVFFQRDTKGGAKGRNFAFSRADDTLSPWPAYEKAIERRTAR